MKNLSALLILFLGFSVFLSAHADENYKCLGGTGDVSFTFTQKKEIYLINSECGVRMKLDSKTAQICKFVGVPTDDSDLSLCGDSLFISAGVLNKSARVNLRLNGGESAGNYQCHRTHVE